MKGSGLAGPTKQSSSRARIPQVDTTTYDRATSGVTRAKQRRRAQKRNSRRSNTTNNSKTLITRRNLLLGAAGIGALAVGAGTVLSRSGQENTDESIATLQVAEDAVFDLESCVEIDPADAFELIGDYELPFGTLVWADDDSIAACLFPTEEPSPLVNMGVLQLGNGSYYIVREEAVGTEEGFEIYDVRASSAGLIWLEAALMEGLWRIYVAALNAELTLGEPRLVEEGNTSKEVPSLAIIGDLAFWQTMAPVTNENARREPASVHRVQISTGKAQAIYNAVGRMSAPLMPYEEKLVFTPRHEDAPSYCDLVCLDTKTNKVTDQLTLPAGMFPHQVAYGPTGFSFCFENIYDYGGGIANLGTYAPAHTHAEQAYTDLPWFRFNRTPTAAPCWCGNTWFMVKSNQSVCAVNFDNKVFCSFGAASGCLDWGDFLVSSGKHDTVVTAMQIDQVDTEGNETTMTEVRVWRPLAKALTQAEDGNTQQKTEESN